MNDNIYLDVYIKVLNIVIIISFHKNWRIVNKIIDLQGYTMKKAFLVSPPHKPPPKHMARKTLLSYGNVKKTTAGSKCQENNNNNNNSQEDSKLNKNGNTMEKTLNSESKVEVGSILSIKPRKAKNDNLNTKFLNKLKLSNNNDNNTSELLLETARTDPLLNILTKAGKNLASENDILSAAETGNIAGVMSILVKGFHPDACTGLNGYRPLHYAVTRGHINIAERLLFFGASIDVKTEDGETALMLASYKGYHNIVEMLLDKGANVDFRNNFGETALFYAARRGFPTVVRLLLERGADNQIKSKFKDLARDDCLNKRTEVAFDDVKTIKPTSGGPAKCLVGRLLLNVLSFLDSTSLCRAAQVNGRWHGKASQKDLWNSLGLSRWEMAMRQTMPEASTGFTMAPFMSSYRPSSSRSVKSNGSQGSNSQPNSRPTSSSGSNREIIKSFSEKSSITTKKKKDDNNIPAISDENVRTVPGFSADFLFD